MSTFYSEFREGNGKEKEWREQMLAAAMSSHLRLGQMSSLSRVGPDMFRYIGELGLIEPLPQLQIVEFDRLKKMGLPIGVSAELFNPHEPSEIDMTLLLRITVLLDDHHKNETIFSGHVLPLISGGILRVRTPSSKQGQYHTYFIQRHGHGNFEVNVFWSDSDSIKRYGRQIKTIDEQNMFIKQDTPQGLSVEIIRRSTVVPAQDMWAALQWPPSMPIVHSFLDDLSGFFYSDNPMVLSPQDEQHLEFSLFVAGHVVFKVPVVDPADPSRTIGCKHIDDEGFKIVARVTYLRYDRLDLYVSRFDTTDPRSMTQDYGTQSLYLDDPEPLQRMHQDLLGGYISFRVERLADGLAKS